MEKVSGVRKASWMLAVVLMLLAVAAGLLFGMNPFEKKGSGDAFILDVPYISQKGLLPTGCEIVSALMMLRYYGYDVTADEFIDQYLEKGDFYTDDEGNVYGVHPANAFAGNPRSENGYGCYAPVIVDSLNKIVDEGQWAVDMTGTPLEALLEDYVKKEAPVLVWASIEMRQTSPGAQWTVGENGEKFTWIRQEHCMVLVGYDDQNYYFNDPYNGNGVVPYDKELAEKRYGELGQQAVVLMKKPAAAN